MKRPRHRRGPVGIRQSPTAAPSRIRRRSRAGRHAASAGQSTARLPDTATGRSYRARSPRRGRPTASGLSRHHCTTPAPGARFVFAFPHGRLAPVVQTITRPPAQRNTVVSTATRVGQPHAECSVDRRHQILRDRPRRVVMRDALAERSRCLGADRRDASHGECRHGCCHNPHGAMLTGHRLAVRR